MPKIKNKEKFLISNYSFRISLFFISVFLLIILISYSKNILSFFPKYIQKQSEEYGYVLKDIDIYGVKKISKQDILLKLSNNFDKSVFLLPLKKIEEQLIQHNNWIESLTIKIKYPSAMILNFKEKKPIAIYFENIDDYFYIDSLGRPHEYGYRLSEEDAGVLLLFPSQLLHTVYPFYDCDEDRISVSGNITINTSKLV